MGVHNLDAMFNPKSVALIGASNRSRALGQVVMHNLVDSTFAGLIMPVNPKEKTVHDVPAYPNIASLPSVPDLAIICIPPAGVLLAIKELIVRGARAVIILTAGLELVHNEKGQSLQDEVADVARAAGLRILGPNCVGLLVPSIGLNASFSPLSAKPGSVAFVSQSGALCTGIIDWAHMMGVGFSHFVSIGNAVETDVADIIEYLGSCSETSAILLYIESIVNGSKFIKVARKVSRLKPIIAIKSGASEIGAMAAASHTGALAGADNVYDAALARAGVLRVKTFDEIFEATYALSSLNGHALAHGKSKHLTILTNGGGAGVLAVDALSTYGGKLTALSQETMAKLDAILPVTWSHNNPVDVLGDASVERYEQAFKILVDAPEVGSILVMHCPLAVVSATDVAAGIVKVIKETKTTKPISTCWIGGELVSGARRIFTENEIPGYLSPEKSIRGYSRIGRFCRNQELLASEDTAEELGITPDTSRVRTLLDASLAKGVDMLNEHDAKSVLRAYGIPVAETRVTKTPDESAKAADEIGFPVVLKIMSDDISHKSDAGGVVLDLQSAQDVRAAAIKMNEHIGKTMPHARLSGFTVQNMIKRSNAHELILGVSTDPVFGPAILFGQGGVSVEIVKDTAIALAPVNRVLAKDLISRTRISKLLAGYRDRPAADIDQIAASLCRISRLIKDFPAIKELDINPLLADDQGVIALDARIRVETAKGEDGMSCNKSECAKLTA
jgi:acetyltransferase